jgi:hypothetical protein
MNDDEAQQAMQELFDLVLNGWMRSLAIQSALEERTILPTGSIQHRCTVLSDLEDVKQARKSFAAPDAARLLRQLADFQGPVQ